MPDYSQAKVYKVSSPNHSLVYYGSTVLRLDKRMSVHRSTSSHCTSKQIVDAGDAVIEQVEEYPCMNKHELLDREAEVMLADWDGCVNEAVPGAYRRAGGKKAYNREYNEKNAEKIKAHNTKKHQCECGGKFTHVNKQRHFKSKKHQAYISIPSPV